jgi:biopolymer transport protein ExbD
MAFGRINRRPRGFILPKLQITSMMDMFTIILIFLLFSFSDNPEDMTLEKNLDLPKSNAKMDYKDNIRLIVSKDKLKIGDSVIAKLENGKVVGLNPDQLDKSTLYKKLKEENAKVSGIDNNDKQNHILFLCDKQLSFKTINNIIKTAGMAGFPNFQFAVLKN